MGSIHIDDKVGVKNRLKQFCTFAHFFTVLKSNFSHLKTQKVFNSDVQNKDCMRRLLYMHRFYTISSPRFPEAFACVLIFLTIFIRLKLFQTSFVKKHFNFVFNKTHLNRRSPFSRHCGNDHMLALRVIFLSACILITVRPCPTSMLRRNTQVRHWQTDIEDLLGVSIFAQYDHIF